MTTFNFKNYEGLVETPSTQEPTVTTTPVDASTTQPTDIPATDTTATSGLDSIQVMVSGPISSIVANALNLLFKNSTVTEYTEESSLKTMGTNYIVTLEASIDKPILIYSIDSQAINKDPAGYGKEVTTNIKKFSQESNKDILVYIDTHGKGFHTTKEEWFLTNTSTLAKKMFYSLEMLSLYLGNILKNTRDTKEV